MKGTSDQLAFESTRYPNIDIMSVNWSTLTMVSSKYTFTLQSYKRT